MARLLAPVLAQLGLLVTVLALVAVAGVVLSRVSVDRLTGDLQPAATANRAVLLDLTEMDAALADWALTGDRASVDAYRQASARLAGHGGRVRVAASEHPQVAGLVDRAEAARTRWVTQYAVPRLAVVRPAEREARRLSRRGEQLFQEAAVAHHRVQEALDQRARAATRQLTWAFRGTVLGVLALGLLGWLAVGRARRRLLRGLSEPLLSLESVVHRMARRDPDVRAVLRGPKEVRAVAAALNELADARSRARAVESRIQDELRVLDTAKDDFVSNVSHELRTPLTTISGYLELVAEEFEGRMEPHHERVLEATRRNVNRLKSLIDDLLTLSQAENRPAELEPDELGPALRDAVTDVRLTAARRGIRIEVEVPERPLPLLADRAMLQRALLNLLTNAVKFSREGGCVEVSARAVDQEAVIAVADHGIGIPGAELDRLGTRFFRASNAVTNEIAGTGLGLRIVQTIVDRHGGELLIASREGVGTTVTLRLPLRAVPGEPGTVPAPTSPLDDTRQVATTA